VLGTLFVISHGYRAFTDREIQLLTAIGQQIGVAVENARLYADTRDRLAQITAFALENARLFQAEQRRAEQFRVIGDVGRRITSILVIDELLDQLARLICEAFGYYHVGIGLVEGDEVVYRAGAGELWDSPDFQFQPARLKVGREGITGWVAASGEPVLIPDVSLDPRYVWMQGSSTRSELSVPLKVKGEVIGVLDVQSDGPDAFDKSDLLVLQSLAHQAAVAIENARLYDQARRVAVVEERQRLARELHDSVTQALYGATLYAEAAARQLDAGAVGSAANYLRELRDTAQEALREMRLLIFELRPSVLESAGLAAALRVRLEAVEERAGLAASFEVQGEGVLSLSVEEGLYRIAQEALNNALKHAAARRVAVRLAYEEVRVVLEIKDDGIGFGREAEESGGLGLRGMAERAAQMGGTLALDSQLGAGTTIRVEVPR
jgi:signal transduction histidine kinase